jgi:hypothetical protein
LISVSRKFVRYPLDVNELYWLQNLGRDGSTPSPASFFFATPDGSELQPAMQSVERFITALADTVAEFPSLPCTAGLSRLLDELTAADIVPAPRYPQPGDANVSGIASWVVSGGWWANQVDENGNHYAVWVGQLYADITANGYSTPPADSGVQFAFQFRSLVPVVKGQRIRFDIAQGSAALYATNVR